MPPVNLTSGTSIGFFTPGAAVTFALQSTTGISRAEITLICPRYPGLHQNTYVWTPGQVNAFTVVMPANTEVTAATTLSGILVATTVTDGISSVASSANYIESKTGGASLDFQMASDYVIVAALPAYTNTAGSLLGNANGAITSAMADGVTPAVGDTFILPPGIAGAAVDVGIYVITAVGAAGAKFSAVQANSWQQGSVIPNKAEVLIAKGTVFAGTTWVVTNTGTTNAVGVASFTLYPRAVFQSITLSASGNRAITNVPILSATQSFVVCDKTASGGTVTSTIRYETAAAPTPGALGTVTTTVQASVAAGTANTADQSVLTVGIFNQV